LARAFYSFHNTKTPVAISLGSMGLNVCLSFLFVYLFSFENFFRGFFVNFLSLQGIDNVAVIGLPLAVSVSVVFQFFLLLFFLRKEVGRIRLAEALRSIRKIILATMLMASAVYLTLWAVSLLVDMATFAGLFIQTTAAVAVGLAVYLFSACILKSTEVKNIWASVRGQFKRD
jgi:putative peptidoglycan lipid II flippase